MRTAARILFAAATLAATTACARQSASPSRMTSGGSSGMSSGMMASDPIAVLTDGFDANVRRDIETLRRATDRFHDRSAAEAVGYPAKIPACIADASMGGMGHHFIDRNLFDEKLEIEKPEMLLYAPTADGKLELVAVEYVVPYRAVPATAPAPRLFGQELKKYDQFNYWALHVWAWKQNKAGLFADWNPAVTCPPKPAG